MILARTSLSERIERWVETGKATKIPLHPKDYWTLDRAGLIDKVSAQYGLDVVCLGGEAGLKSWTKEHTTEGRREEGEKE